MPHTLPDRVRVGAFEVDLRIGELREGEDRIILSEQPLRVLRMLVERDGELVEREEIRKTLWPNDTVVEFDHSINAAIRNLRRALGDSPDEPKYIETIPRRGYRLMVPVETVVACETRSTQVSARAAGGDVTALPTGLQPTVLRRRTVSHYRVLDIIGGGGMGVVYRAEDLKLGRGVALKFLPEELGSDPRALERFSREARAASSLDHPNICSIYQFGDHESRPFIVMPLLEGQTLRERLAADAENQKGMPLGELLDIGIQVSEGLQAAHEKGIIHRDIKPANIFITSKGVVKILDFGLAKLLEASEQEEIVAKEEDHAAQPASRRPNQAELTLTRTDVSMGTASYMSPEQVRGEKIDVRTDLFSFGLVLYEMATGTLPFRGGTWGVIFKAILNSTPTAALRLNPNIPSRLDEIVNKCLEKNRNLRYQNISEVRTDLQRLKRDTESHQAPRPEARSVARVHSTSMVVAVMVLAAFAAGGYFVLHRPANKLTDKDTIVLSDFENKTGDAVFDDTLKTALNISLQQSPFLNVLSDEKVAENLKLMTRPADTRLTPDVARELCQRAGSKAYISGSIASLGSQYVVALKAVSCLDGDALAQGQATAATKEKVMDSLGASASKLRGELGESLASVQKFDVPLAQATTSSLEALKEYSLGEKVRRLSSAAAALSHHQRAVEIDPAFASAYAQVGRDYYSLAEEGRASEYYVRAFQLRQHSSEREKLKIAGDYYWVVTGELNKAENVYLQQLQNYPRDNETYSQLGHIYYSQGQYEKAAEKYRQSLRIVPDDVNAYQNLITILLALHRFDEVRQTAQEAMGRKLDDFVLHVELYALAFLDSDSSRMADEQRWFSGKPEEDCGLSLFSDTEAYAGRLQRARELTNQSVDSAIREDSKERGAISQEVAAQREAAFGYPTNAEEAASRGLRSYPASHAVKVEAALAFAMAGDVVRARSLVQDLSRRYPNATQIQSLWLPAINAQIALARHNSALALSILQASSSIEFGGIDFTANVSCLYPTYIRGEAYLAAGQGKEAAVEFQTILDRSSIVLNCWTGALARLGVARANALQARTSQGADADAARVRALATYKDFLTLWKDADSDIPIYKQAKLEYGKLQ